jgi:hypothetical protein
LWGDHSREGADAEADSFAALRNDSQNSNGKDEQGKDENSRRFFDSLRSLRMTSFPFDGGLKK